MNNVQLEATEVLAVDDGLPFSICSSDRFYVRKCRCIWADDDAARGLFCPNGDIHHATSRAKKKKHSCFFCPPILPPMCHGGAQTIVNIHSQNKQPNECLRPRVDGKTAPNGFEFSDTLRGGHDGIYYVPGNQHTTKKNDSVR